MFSDGYVSEIKRLGVSVIEFGSVTDLIGEPGKEAGYYAVTGAGVFYFDGAAFDPPISLEGYIETAAGFVYLPDVADTDLSLVTLIGPSIGFPSIRDYVGLYSDAELTVDGGALVPRVERGIAVNRYRRGNQYPYKSSLKIIGEVCVRVLVRVRGLFATNTSIDLCDFSNFGESAAANSLYNLNMSDDDVDSFSESGSGTDCRGNWFLPLFPKAGLDLLIELRRTAGFIDTMWVNGLPLRWINSFSGGSVNNTTGAHTRVAPTGGETGLLAYDGLGDDDLVDVVFAGVSYDLSVHTAAEFAAGKAEFTTRQLADFNFDDAAAKALVAGAVSVFSATGGVTDATGNVTTWTTNTIATQKFIGDDSIARPWAISGSAKVYNAALRIDGDLTINFVAMIGNNSENIFVECGESGETVATNFLYRLVLKGSTNRIAFFYEYGLGTNMGMEWAFSADWFYNEIREIRLVREEIGAGLSKFRCYDRRFGSDTWTQLTVAVIDSPGTGATTTEATAPSTAGSGSSNYFQIPSTAIKWRQIDLFNAAVNP